MNDQSTMPNWADFHAVINAMPKYKILASREIYYEFEVESDSPENAELLVRELSISGDIAKYAYDFAPLDVFDNEKSE